MIDREIYAWIRDLFHDERINPAPLSPQAAVSAALLPAAGFRGDAADCFLYATARELAVPLVTKDRAIREHATASGDLRVVW